ncbi:hypothetical protein [Candidatus Nitrospira bockiana]
MGLLQRLAHDLRAGVAKLRYGTVQAAHRALEETELLQLRLEVRKLDTRIDELCGDIGERALHLHDRGESASEMLNDPELLRGIEQVLMLRAERAKVLAEMDEVRSER